MSSTKTLIQDIITLYLGYCSCYFQSNSLPPTWPSFVHTLKQQPRWSQKINYISCLPIDQNSPLLPPLIWIKFKLFTMTYRDLPGQGTALLSDYVSIHAHFKSLPWPFSALKPSLLVLLCLYTCCFFHLESSLSPSHHLGPKSHTSYTFSDLPR